MRFEGMSRFAALAIAASACTGAETATPPVPEPAPTLADSPHPALLLSQAWFEMVGGRPVPQPAKLVIWRTDGVTWESETLLDPESNVFHKAILWKGGILTIGASKARLVHWKRGDDKAWKPTVLWEKSWGGDFDRLRDLEIADVDGDGADDIVLATHDQGVVAVGKENMAGWQFTEIDSKPDTFVHEIEIGDVDGDGKMEIYATPSDRNRASLVSQSGGVARYDWDAASSTWKRTQIVLWEDSHAKEILVTSLGGGPTRLYAAREGHTEKGADGVLKVVDPVRIVRLDPGPEGAWTQTIVATLEDTQCRFLLAADVDGDGRQELIATGMKSGVHLLRPNEDGTFDRVLIDASSSGFEHAVDVADLDGDGKVEIYVAADDQKGLRRYVWDGSGFARTEVGGIPTAHLTWSLQDGTL